MNTTPITNPDPIVYPRTKPTSIILACGVPHTAFAQHWIRIERYDATTAQMIVEIRIIRTQPGEEQAVGMGDCLTIDQQQYPVLALQPTDKGRCWLELDTHPTSSVC